MRTVTLSGQDFIVNPLKGKDIKALKAQGFDLMGGGYSISDGRRVHRRRVRRGHH